MAGQVVPRVDAGEDSSGELADTPLAGGRQDLYHGGRERVVGQDVEPSRVAGLGDALGGVAADPGPIDVQQRDQPVEHLVRRVCGEAFQGGQYDGGGGVGQNRVRVNACRRPFFRLA
ncbi:hypothetical protein [Amycolatopsis sp. WQ 127309]|uniref:hypothetical protein n=1 Tax=Amycolatopsis sp. WQ 127309 TaxID=2932773 RepID=UPI001FF5AB8B|nr:hypothetical protein [Amycolatopsis sp. WQ 127309]UOZ04983.1 hypothetical protein MUY22_40145 [Amycolatopsis sp. WQ 127309]